MDNDVCQQRVLRASPDAAQADCAAAAEDVRRPRRRSRNAGRCDTTSCYRIVFIVLRIRFVRDQVKDDIEARVVPVWPNQRSHIVVHDVVARRSSLREVTDRPAPFRPVVGIFSAPETKDVDGWRKQIISRSWASWHIEPWLSASMFRCRGSRPGKRRFAMRGASN